MSVTLISRLDTNGQRVLGNVREAAQRIWARPQHRYYTDHTTAHSERVIALLDGLTTGMMATDKPLSSTEIFALLAAAYLHDIGMQDERAGDPSASSGQDPEAIRADHHKIAAELIYRAAEDPAQALHLGLLHDPGLVEAVALVAKGHRKVNLQADEYDSLVHGGETIRLRLLAALLRFGDELDIDHRRVDLEMMKLWALPVESQLHWWKCHYVSGVNIVDEYIKIAYRFPQACPDYESLIVPLIEGGVRRTLGEMEDIFRADAVKAALGKSQVRAMRLVQAMPADVENLARKLAVSRESKVMETVITRSQVTINQSPSLGLPAAEAPASDVDAEVASLNRRLAQLKRNLLAIQEKRAGFIDPRSAPPDLEESERLTREEIAKLETRLAELNT